MTSKRPSVAISVVSAKGGVGKTTLTSSLAMLLARLGHKVLLVDTDLVTNGLTLLLGPFPKKRGIIELLGSYSRMTPKEKSYFLEDIKGDLICPLSDGVDLIQSSSFVGAKHTSLVFDNLKAFDSLCQDIIGWVKSTGDYDFIIVDSQAGSVPTTFVDVQNSDKVVIVMEPDPFVTRATNEFATEISDKLPKESFFLVNKLSAEEVTTYNAIEKFLRVLNHLPPIPFDFEVRRKFMLKRVPFDLDRPTPFTFGLMRMTRELLPGVAPELEGVNRILAEKALTPSRQRLREADQELALLMEERSELSRKRRRREVILNQTLVLFGLVGALALLTYFSGTTHIGLNVYELSIVSLALIFGAGLTLWGLREPERESQSTSLESVEKRIDELRSRVVAEENYLSAEEARYRLDSSQDEDARSPQSD